MNEWDFIGEDIFVGIGKSATSNNFEIGMWLVEQETLWLFNPHDVIAGTLGSIEGSSEISSYIR